MDARLEYTKEIFETIRRDFEAIRNQMGIQFCLWNDIPTECLQSFFENEISINPATTEFEDWKSKLKKRPVPLYSVALCENKVVGSVYSGLIGSERSLNLWHVDENFRGRSIGKAVLLNCISSLLETSPETPVVAWDITSAQVAQFLTHYGFVLTK